MRAMIGALLVVLVLGGCAQFRHLHSRPSAEGSADLDFLVRLNEAGEAELERIGRAFDPPIDAAMSPRPALRHALWQGTPGHPGHDPEAARKLLHNLLDPGVELTAAQTQIARVYLAELERRARLRRANMDLSEANRELREQIEALTNLESEMGGDDGNGE